MMFRPATMEDAQLLFDWRNDPSTRAASHNTQAIEFSSHVQWLERALADKNRRLLIAMVDGIAVGTCRTDHAGGATELSWTVAPHARGKGIGRKMVTELARATQPPLTAEIRADNAASIKIAEAAGFSIVRASDGILYLEKH